MSKVWRCIYDLCFTTYCAMFNVCNEIVPQQGPTKVCLYSCFDLTWFWFENNSHKYDMTYSISMFLTTAALLKI